MNTKINFESWRQEVDVNVRFLLNVEHTDAHGFDFDYQTYYRQGFSPESAAGNCAEKLLNEGWCY
jgi:hypothetical protein